VVLEECSVSLVPQRWLAPNFTTKKTADALSLYREVRKLTAEQLKFVEWWCSGSEPRGTGGMVARAVLMKAGYVIAECEVPIEAPTDVSEAAKLAYAEFHRRFPTLSFLNEDICVLFQKA
jgi:hypothetical protein